ncbi:unnamed protein product [Schistocephalus solidus]|uniref:Ras modification protein ERF4 n=1 Tax=Schistocephalus solidus TaxID=70667 RepID=A0A183TA89_SCHSO|nr:unnamed protein product [Schistocephalus solidus]
MPRPFQHVHAFNAYSLGESAWSDIFGRNAQTIRQFQLLRQILPTLLWTPYTHSWHQFHCSHPHGDQIIVLITSYLHQYQQWLWEEVTHNLKVGNIDAATDAKTRLEQRQRREAAARQEANEKWNPHFFSEQGNSYIYRWPLAGRIYQAPSDNITQSNNLADPLACSSMFSVLHPEKEPPTPTPPNSGAFDDLHVSGTSARSEDGGLEMGQAVLELSASESTDSELD